MGGRDPIFYLNSHKGIRLRRALTQANDLHPITFSLAFFSRFLACAGPALRVPCAGHAWPYCVCDVYPCLVLL